MAEPEIRTGPVTADSAQPRSLPSPVREMTPEEEIASLRGPNYTVASEDTAPKLGKKGPKKRRFHSQETNLRLQMMTKPPRVDADGGRIPSESRFVQFKPDPRGGGRLITEDMDEILCVESSRAYGATIYDMDAMARHVQASRDAYVEKIVEDNPSLMKRLAAKMGAKDFTEGDKKDDKNAPEGSRKPKVPKGGTPIGE